KPDNLLILPPTPRNLRGQITLVYIHGPENRIGSRAHQNRGDKSFMTHAPVDPTNGNEPTYSFRPSVLGAPRNFRLSTGAIIWDAGRHSGQIDYARVTRTRMSFRPAGTQNHRFVTEIWSH